MNRKNEREREGERGREREREREGERGREGIGEIEERVRKEKKKGREVNKRGKCCD